MRKVILMASQGLFGGHVVADRVRQLKRRQVNIDLQITMVLTVLTPIELLHQKMRYIASLLSGMPLTTSCFIRHGARVTDPAV